MINTISWDVGGRSGTRALIRHYYKQTEALIFVVDSTDHKRFEAIKDEMKRMLPEDELAGVPILFFYNKQDLPNAKSPSEITDKLGLHSIRNEWHSQACCATNGDGLYEGLDWLTHILDDKVKRATRTQNNPSISTFKVAPNGNRTDEDKKPLPETSATSGIYNLFRCIL